MMPQSPKLPQATLSRIAAQLAGQLSPHSLGLLAAGDRLEVAESFESWFLPRRAIAQPNAPISTLAHRTGYWHHQIRQGGIAKEYANSAPHGPDDEDWTVHAVRWGTDLPGQIDAAIRFLDGLSDDGEEVVRLLSAPSYLTLALWYEEAGTDRLVVARMPAAYAHLAYEVLYTGPEFLQRLGQEIPVRSIRRPAASATVPQPPIAQPGLAEPVPPPSLRAAPHPRARPRGG